MGRILRCAFFAFAFLFIELQSADIEQAPVKVCAGISCPEGTTFCKKITNTTEDKEKLDVHIKCMGERGVVLAENKTQLDNPYPDFEIQSVSIQGVFKLPDFLRRNNTNLLTPAPDSEFVKEDNIEKFD